MDASDSDSDAPPEMASSRAAPEDEDEEVGAKAGRANKNRPAQLSTKRKVLPFRVAPGLAAAPVKVRDPRFDPGAKVDEEKWRKSYAFLADMEKAEAEEMKRKLSESSAASHRASQRGGGAKRQRVRDKVLSAEDTEAIKHEMERITNRVKQEERKAKRGNVKAEIRREEVAAVKDGKKPFFAKKSALRERELVAQYEELRKEGRLDKFLEKRRRKNATKQHRRMPMQSTE